MKTNEGLSDRVIRMYLGVIIAGIGIYNLSVWAALGIPVFISGITGICPLYPLLGINTFGRADAEQ